MNRIFILIIVFIVFSCGRDKVVLLPEIQHANISEISDVSAAYLFYDETRNDRVELNRKNLISTTNWLLNIDKRLSLKQVIPHIKYLQEKKKNSSHKNENAKNYFTCNDLRKNSLGFIEFTDIMYHEESSETYISNIIDLKGGTNGMSISFNLDGDIAIVNPNSEPFIIATNAKNLVNELKKLDIIQSIIYLNFNEGLRFQEYISYKSLFENAQFQKLKISNHEFLHN